MNKVKFFPIFLVATFSALIDSIAVLLDEAVIGNMFDDVAFGAINLIEPYMMIETFISYLICIGGNALIVRAKAGDNKDEAKRIFNHCITCTIIIGVISGVIAGVFDTQLVTLVAGDSSAYQFAMDAFFWDRFTLVTASLYAFMVTYVLYMGGNIISFISLVLELVINLVLSTFLGGIMGISGVTCATFISQVISLVILLIYVICKEKGFHYRPYIDVSYVKKLLLLGIPEASVFLSFLVVEFFMNAYALDMYSVRGLAVVAIIINLFEVVAFVSEGISEYETVMLNKALGAGDRGALALGMKIVFRAAVSEAVFFSLLFLVGAPLIVDSFGIDDASTVRTAIAAIRMMAITPIALIFTRITFIFCQYTERIGRAVVILFLSLLVAPCALAYILGQASLELLCLGFVTGPILVGVFLWIFRKKLLVVEL